MIDGGRPTIIQGRGFNQFVQQLSAGSVQINDMELYLGATERATLGRFDAYVSGTLRGGPGGWRFQGTMRFHDIEKFDQSATGTWYRNAVCYLVSRNFTGKDYEVNSEMAPIKQSASDREIQWAGTGIRNSPGYPEKGE
jgi:hypothetical protein